MRKFLALALFLTSATIFAQGTITGKVVDSEMEGPLPGANIMVVGTNNGTVTDFDGNFALEVDKTSGEIEVSFVGYERKVIPFTVANGATTDLGSIVLSPDSEALEEIVITSFSLAIDRKTPVAVSTIKAADIETKIGNQEFPEILKSTPGVYATKQGGGFGDAELRLRGFNSENIAVMINGVPVNDMENGRVYWSNWAGLSDVTRSMQVQRGLGASKVAVPSIGGTVNIVTKTTDAEEGGNLFATTGNDGYMKFGATVSTGVLDNGVAATVSASKTTGNGYIDGTEFEAYSYFVNIAKDFGDDHQLSFTAFGAPQEHGQRETQHLIETYRLSERGTKFNGDWGYLNGEVTHIQDNFYHKPQMSLNHYWDISERTNLSTALYASFGTGGGGGYQGNADLRSIDSPYRNGFLQPFNLDLVVAENVENGDLGSETILYNSRNDHKWYGALSTLSTEITETIELLGGVDFRYYKGEHFREVKDLLGGTYWLEDSDINNPNNVARVGDKMSYYNDGIVLWEGGFAQLEYSENDLSAFVSLAASNTSYKRVDYFNYLDSDPEQETDFIHFFGYSAKGGANYNIDNNHNVFANIGYFEKAPFFNAVFQNFQNDINEDAENQKIFSAELGYGFRSTGFRANVNVYSTRWSDRTFTQSYFDRASDQTYFANILGVDALHQGIEVDFSYRPFSTLTITGMASIGDWNWDSDVTDVFVYDENQDVLNPDSPISLLLQDVPVGGSAQHTFALGFNYEALPGTNVRMDYNYYDNLFADFDPNNVDEGYMPWEVPAYGVVDFGLTHNFAFGDFEATLIGNVNNLLDTEYIAVADDGPQSNARTAQVYYGFGRTYTVGAKIKF
ncbi:Outer membrane receptor proteins, mostly Fe transport [Salinimicrobium catena]|uniref:Outer membrane receptor proteins, mostly Fe transport n=1 Tax=Salinimicrobium catena TaxID=390640 RepID=A0A1H5J7P8_9FLAO|nr:carboxypeptidase-like regulatory domain-containing protein [Salinimicrobium catena]SDK84727.1 Outer membrane receptor proteins, mostly Fe transport [Salinimicrobium catena]SEE48081.1 Outer membrane receptor proteins, mostly Fe transport [Salinimicrobium catena]